MAANKKEFYKFKAGVLRGQHSWTKNVLKSRINLIVKFQIDINKIARHCSPPACNLFLRTPQNSQRTVPRWNHRRKVRTTQPAAIHDRQLPHQTPKQLKPGNITPIKTIAGTPSLNFRHCTRQSGIENINPQYERLHPTLSQKPPEGLNANHPHPNDRYPRRVQGNYRYLQPALPQPFQESICRAPSRMPQDPKICPISGPQEGHLSSSNKIDQITFKRGKKRDVFAMQGHRRVFWYCAIE